MALGLDANPFLLKEWEVQAGTWTSPELIGTDVTDPLSRFSGAIIGYIQQGSMNVNIPREYAEFLSKTPGILIRKDLTRKSLQIEGSLGQFDVDAIELLKNVTTQAGYGVTVPSAKTLDLSWFGSDEPTQTPVGLLLTSALTDGTPFYLSLWSSRFQTEDNSIATSGTDYALQPFTADAFVHPNFTSAQADKHYGLLWRDIT